MIPKKLRSLDIPALESSMVDDEIEIFPLHTHWDQLVYTRRILGPDREYLVPALLEYLEDHGVESKHVQIVMHALTGEELEQLIEEAQNEV